MAGRDDHIKPLRLFELARQRGTQPNEQEKVHLRTCEECQRIVEVFARQFGKPWQPPLTNPEDAA
ncbi:MAG TPA: hypothetical protein VER98_09620 [Terriglobia bacterium]|nr:hypothetical protein [Terriglobia bacterium]